MNRARNSDPFVVVVGMDFSWASHVALSQAFCEAALRPRSDLHVVHVAASIQENSFIERSAAEERVLAQQRLERLIRGDLETFTSTSLTTGDVPRVSVTAHVRTGRAGQEIAQFARDLSANLIVVGTNGRRGISRLLLGSVSHTVVSLAPCPVLVARHSNGALARRPERPGAIAVFREDHGTPAPHPLGDRARESVNRS